MRRVGAASLVTINPMARPDRDAAGKDGNVTGMFAEAIKVPACVMPVAEEPVRAPAPPPPPLARPVAEPAPTLASPLAEPAPDLVAVRDAPEPARPTWHERMTRAIVARFRRAPSEDEAADDAKERLERFQSRRSGPGSPF